MKQVLIVSPLFFIAASAAAVPPPPERPPEVINLAPDNCPVFVSGTVSAYAFMPFSFEAAAGNVLLLAMEDPTSELVFSLSDGTDGDCPSSEHLALMVA